MKKKGRDSLELRLFLLPLAHEKNSIDMDAVADAVARDGTVATGG